MAKITNDINNKIAATAKLLPVVLGNTHEKHLLTGAEILEFGTITEIEGKQIKPEQKYLMPMPVQLYQNHVRRLKKAWLKHGYDGIKSYVSHVESIVKNSK